MSTRCQDDAPEKTSENAITTPDGAERAGQTAPLKFKRTKWTAAKAIAMRGALEVGASITLACKRAGISRPTYYAWRDDVPGFAEMVDIASASAKLVLVETVWNAANGIKCEACEYGVMETPDGIVEVCPACRGCGFTSKPDGKLALSVLERVVPEDYGKTDTINHTVDSTVQLAAQVSSHVQLEHVPPADLAALAWNVPAPALLSTLKRDDEESDDEEE